MTVGIPVPEHPDLHILRFSQRDLQPDGALIVKRCDFQGFDTVFRHPFHPDCLPDSALGGVKHAVRFEALLAPALAAVVRVILNPNPERIVTLLEIICHIEGKGEIAVFVFPEKVAVPPDAAPLIHSSEMEQKPLVFRNGVQIDEAEIPEIFSRTKLAAHAGTETFRRKRHKDLSVRTLGPFALLCKRIIPGAIKADPVFPAKLRPGILRQDAARVDLLTPDRSHSGNCGFFMFLWFQCRNGIK